MTTYDAYTEETSYENSLMVQQSGTLALSSLTHVMRSLPLNARGIFLLLVQHQLDNKDNPNFMGTQAFVGFKCLVFGLVLTIVYPGRGKRAAMFDATAQKGRSHGRINFYKGQSVSMVTGSFVKIKGLFFSKNYCDCVWPCLLRPVTAM